MNVRTAVSDAPALGLVTKRARRLAKQAALAPLAHLAEFERGLHHEPERDGGPPGEIGVFPTLYAGASIMLGGLLEFLAELESRYGAGPQMRPVRFRFLNKPSVLLSHPDHVDRAFRDMDHFGPSSDPQILARFRRLLGFNLASTDHETWRRTRPRTSAYLNGPVLTEYGQVMREVMEQDMLPILSRAARTGERLVLFDTMLTYSSRVVFRSFMRLGGSDIPAEIHPTLNRLFDHVRRHVMQPSLPMWVPSPANQAFKRDRDIVRSFVSPRIAEQAKLDTMLGSIIRAHTSRSLSTELGPRIASFIESLTPDPEPTPDQHEALVREVEALLSKHADATVHDLGKKLARLATGRIKKSGHSSPMTKEAIQARLEAIFCEGGHVDRETVLEEMVSNLIGASETTVLLMTWGLYYLGRVPHVQARLHEEACADPDVTIPEIEPATFRRRWPYLFNVMREILRLAPPAAVFNRPVIADVELDGFTLSAGTTVWGCQYLSHRSPHIWQDPEQFMPERWDQPVTPGSFFPFTLGPRQCVGMNYSYVEAGIALATIAKYFRVECLTKDVGYDLGLTYRPDRPVEIVLHGWND